MAIVSTGQITIVDYNDALTLRAFIGCNMQKTQMYNPDNATYAPDWTKTNLILKPTLFKLGSSSDIASTAEVTSCEWYDISGGTEVKLANDTNYAISTTKPISLTIKSNVMAGKSGKDYMCKMTYKDTVSGLSLVVQSDISLSSVTNGSGIADAICWLPLGNVFKNDSVGYLQAQCDLWRGSFVDNTNVSYQWYAQDPSATTDTGGGVGWFKVTNKTGIITGVTTNTLTIYPDAVAGNQVFKCIIKDTDATSSTNGQSFMDTCTIADQSDPIQCTIQSSGGTIFKNGVGSTTLTARLFRAGTEIDLDGSVHTYKWYKYNQTGVLVTNFGGTNISFKTGKTLALTQADVDVKATFNIEVESKVVTEGLKALYA